MKYIAAFACKWFLGYKYDFFASTKPDSGFKMLENVAIVWQLWLYKVLWNLET